jgi:hypothetical protein
LSCFWFNLGGGVLEFGGLLLTAVLFIQRQRRTLPERQGLWRRNLRATLVRLRRRGKPPTQPAFLEGVAQGRATASGNLTIRTERASVPTVEERVARLEQVVIDLRREQEEADARLDRRLVDTNERINRATEDLQGQLNVQQAMRRDEFEQSRAFEVVGIGLFLLGVVFSTLGNTLPC